MRLVSGLQIILSNQVVISDKDIAFDFFKKPEAPLPKIVMQLWRWGLWLAELAASHFTASPLLIIAANLAAIQIQEIKYTVTCSFLSKHTDLFSCCSPSC